MGFLPDISRTFSLTPGSSFHHSWDKKCAGADWSHRRGSCATAPTAIVWIPGGTHQLRRSASCYWSKPWHLVNPKIAGKWMFIPLELIIIGFDPPPCHAIFCVRNSSKHFHPRAKFFTKTELPTAGGQGSRQIPLVAEGWH